MITLPKNRLLLGLAIFFLLYLPISARVVWGGPVPTRITIVFDDNYPPYSFRDFHGKLQGILPEEWQVWGEKTGIGVNLIATDWSKAQQIMVQGKADVIDTIFFTEERAGYLDFTRPYATINVPIFFHKNIGGITDAQSLQGFTVGVKAGDACIEILAKNGITILRKFDSYEGLIKAAADQKIRVFCMDEPPALYFLYKMNLENEFRHTVSLYTGEFHRAVKKGNKNLLKIIEDGFSALTPQEHEAIEKKWRGEPLSFARDYVKNILFIAAGGLLIFMVLMLWNRVLRRQVAQKTSQLNAAMQAARNNEEKYRELVEKANSIILKMNHRGEIIFLNEYGQKFFGYAVDDIWGRPALGSIVPETETTGRDLESLMDDLIKHPEKYRDQVMENICRDGRRVWIDWTFRPERAEFGAVDQIFCVGTDITERKEHEVALQESESKFKSIAEQSLIGILLDQDGEIRYVNPKLAEIMGYSTKEILTHLKPHDLVAPEDWVILENVRLERLSKPEYTCRYEIRGITGNREIVHLEIHDSPTVFNHRPAGLRAVLDITERKRLEEQLLQAQKLEAVGTLAGGIAHDFNNILQAISGYVQLLLAQSEYESEFHHYLIEMDQAIERASDLIKRLLTFSRRVEPVLRPLDLNEIVVRTVRMLERTIPKMIAIETDLAEDLSIVKGAPAELEQVIMNLATNARDAMPHGGRIIIQTRNIEPYDQGIQNIEDKPDHRYVLLSFSDFGSGMDLDTLNRIFEPFFTTKGLNEGTGLGLSMVYGIIKSHGGTITCESRPNQGTTFRILLPALDSEQAEEHPNDQAAVFVSSGKETIMLVDDENAILEVADEFLRAYGYRTILTASGEQAVEIYQRKNLEIDLIILDLGMPGMGGRSCLTELLNINPRAKVIVASGYTTDGQEYEIKDVGAKAFISKPYRLTDLLQQLRMLLDEPA
ncbi:MAG: PAS domain S-box protein [Deltaproteobacteria bacterium]|nr:PAS domain S-box protein [Deltaproteobacteria bacterium]